MKFSFGKEARFPSVISGMPKRTATDFTHTIQGTLKHRAAGFGIGDRFKRRASKSPSPGSYEAVTCFSEDGRPRPDSTWGKKTQMSPRAENPTPSSYMYKNLGCGTDAKKFSFRRKTVNHLEPEYQMIKQGLPGPGNYGPKLGMNKVGKYCISNMPNTRTSAFSPSQRFRNKTTLEEMPGPGTYQPDDISVADDKVRSYVLSTFKNCGPSRMVQPYHTLNGKRPDLADRSVIS